MDDCPPEGIFTLEDIDDSAAIQCLVEDFPRCFKAVAHVTDEMIAFFMTFAWGYVRSESNTNTELVQKFTSTVARLYTLRTAKAKSDGARRNPKAAAVAAATAAAAAVAAAEAEDGSEEEEKEEEEGADEDA